VNKQADPDHTAEFISSIQGIFDASKRYKEITRPVEVLQAAIDAKC
jgi:hypothetical protein